MVGILPTFPEQPAASYELVLEDETYRVRLVYRERTAAWYLDLRTQDGTGLALGRRLSPGFAPVINRPEGSPPGVLLVTGLDGYAKGDLGGPLKLLYVSSEDLTPPEAESPALRIVLA